MSFETLVQLEAYLPEISQCESKLGKTLSYALSTQGSLSRARLAYSVASELDLSERHRVSLAAAIEFFHIASLLFDDLPCMDDADTRRGDVCVHRIHGESSTILAALALINRAYFLMYRAFAAADPIAAEEANNLADECLGLAGIINGQALDLNFGQTDQSAEVVRLVAVQKTGALFRLCLLLPAILGRASRYEKMHLARLAELWGLAYQSADDLKDVLLSEGNAGKTVRQDEEKGRPNLALKLGVREATAELDRTMRAASCSVLALSSSYPRKWLGVSLFQKEFLAKVEPLLSSEAVA
ncbi:polyprenyl synthetase family protein [Pelagicoccus albus]|uniref:Polyprenyl synthetase family protein n=1 Tax=Pelagicoccus albus TaxID=415222 RepID=A0A7X1B7R8_9BACT|nr:polyprenyl synthetase family protein [Pelagicoccus albus]MBC2607126.1 polyprenyl synthetase family protein [Pelagicoccus albus]